MRAFKIVFFALLALFSGFAVFGTSVSLVHDIYVLANGGSILQHSSISPRTETGQLVSLILSMMLSGVLFSFSLKWFRSSL
jgi:hypothetical protein